MDIVTLAVQALVPVVGLILVAFGRWALRRVEAIHKDIMSQLTDLSGRVGAHDIELAEMRGYLKAINGRARGATEE